MAKNTASIFINARIFLVLFNAILVSANEDASPYSWREEFYSNMPIDHFSFSPENENQTFDMRFLINDTWWDRSNENSPIFFYTGNEGEVEDYAKNTGLMWDWAPQFKALLIFGEHRYYGKSLPYGNRSHEPANLKYLSVDQVMADYAVFLNWFKKNHTRTTRSPIIAIGGSYGGMLAAWMRVKWPHIITGALASSAPILQLPGGSAPCSSFSSGATRTFAISGPDCEKEIKRSWSVFTHKAKTPDGRAWLSEIFKLCNNSILTEEGPTVDDLMYAMADSYRYMAMSDYPYPTNFIVPLPAWPVKEACKFITDPAGKLDNDTLLMNIRKAGFIFYNHTGDLECLALRQSKVASFDVRLWSFQGCAELTFRRCQDPLDMFRPYSWNEQYYSNLCFKTFGILPRLNWLTLNYGIERLKLATNIIFSSGDLDPWAGSSVNEKSLEGADPSLVAINIRNAAHHYDLRASHPMDTTEVIEARNRMKSIAQSWIAQVKHPGVQLASMISVEKPSTKPSMTKVNKDNSQSPTSNAFQTAWIQTANGIPMKILVPQPLLLSTHSRNRRDAVCQTDQSTLTTLDHFGRIRTEI